MPPHIAAMGQHQGISHNLENMYLRVFIIIIYLYFTPKAIYHVNARIARILLIKILIFDTEDYSDKYSYYELQWELY